MKLKLVYPTLVPKAIREQKKRNRGSHVSQLEKMHCVFGDETSLVFKKRKHYGGTTHGDCIGPILAPSWTETLKHPKKVDTLIKNLVIMKRSSKYHSQLKSHQPSPNGLNLKPQTKDPKETWSLPFGDKKELFGSANRVAVGGKADAEPSDGQKGTLVIFSQWDFIVFEISIHLTRTHPVSKAPDARTPTRSLLPIMQHHSRWRFSGNWIIYLYVSLNSLNSDQTNLKIPAHSGERDLSWVQHSFNVGFVLLWLRYDLECKSNTPSCHWWEFMSTA